MCGGSHSIPVAVGGIPRATKTEANPVAKFFNGKMSSRALAMKAMCCACMGCTKDATEPGFRTMVRECASGPTSKAPCPLHGHRPFQRDDDDGDSE